MKSKTPLFASVQKGPFLRLQKREKPLFFIEKVQFDSGVFSMQLLASDQCNLRQTLGGISTVWGSLTVWEAVATFKVGAPPTGCPLDSMMQVLNIYQQLALEQH